VLDQTLRTVSVATEIGGYTIPAGTTVAASILGVHRSAAHEDAEEFRPERFLGRPPAPYTLIPFGGGVRR
jgi:cytochrome P450